MGADELLHGFASMCDWNCGFCKRCKSSSFPFCMTSVDGRQFVNALAFGAHGCSCAQIADMSQDARPSSLLARKRLHILLVLVGLRFYLQAPRFSPALHAHKGNAPSGALPPTTLWTLFEPRLRCRMSCCALFTAAFSLQGSSSPTAS